MEVKIDKRTAGTRFHRIVLRNNVAYDSVAYFAKPKR